MATNKTTAKAAAKQGETASTAGTMGVSAKALMAAQAATRSEQLQEQARIAEAPRGPVPGVEDHSTMRDDPEADEAEDADVTTLVQHVVTVTNDPATKVATEVYDHEIPVLEAIHGEGNIEIQSSEEIDVTEFTAEAEHDRLLRKYGVKNEAAVRSVFANPNNLARELGLAVTPRVGTRSKAQQAQSLSVDRRVKRAVSAPKATATPKATKAPARVVKPSTKR